MADDFARTKIALNKVGEIRNQDPTLYQAMLEIKERMNAVLLEEPTKTDAQIQSALANFTSLAAVAASSSVPLAIPDSVITSLAFDTNDSTVGDTLHSLGTPDTFLAPKAGWYAFTANITWAAAAAGTRRALYAKKNGTTFVSQDVRVPAATSIYNIAAGACYLAKNDTLAFYAHQDSGGPLNVTFAIASVWRG